MADEFTFMRGKWRCSQCGGLNSLELDNYCQKCMDRALKEDEEKLRHLTSVISEVRQPEGDAS